MILVALKMTPARLALLRAVADPNTDVYAEIPTARGTWSDAVVRIKERTHAVPDGHEVGDGLGACRSDQDGPPAGVRYHSPRAYSLTEAGEKVLADHDTTRD